MGLQQRIGKRPCDQSVPGIVPSSFFELLDTALNDRDIRGFRQQCTHQYVAQIVERAMRRRPFKRLKGAKERRCPQRRPVESVITDNRTSVDVINEVKKMTGGGVDHTFEVVGSTKLLTDCLQMTRPGGNICAVGVPDLTAEVTYPFQALHQNKNLLGIRAGGARPRNVGP